MGCGGVALEISLSIACLCEAESLNKLVEHQKEC